MTQTPTNEPRDAFMADLIKGEQDVAALMEKHGLSPEDAAAWAREPANRDCLLSLSALADLQAQVVLSRHRLLAVTALLRLAHREDEKADIMRRACMDVMSADLRRAARPEAPAETDEVAKDTATLIERLRSEWKRDDSAADDADGEAGR